MNRKAPVNLDLTTIKLPLPAIISILHRVSGVILLPGVALLLWMFDASLQSSLGLRDLQGLIEDNWLFKLSLWLVLSALCWHLVAGVRHLVMDLGLGESLEGGILGAQIALGVAALGILLLGVWLW